eukprot:394562-Rhodomonas_salina.2
MHKSETPRLIHYRSVGRIASSTDTGTGTKSYTSALHTQAHASRKSSKEKKSCSGTLYCSGKLCCTASRPEGYLALRPDLDAHGAELRLVAA